VENYCKTELAADENKAHAHCRLYNEGYKHKLRISNTFLFHCNRSHVIACLIHVSSVFLKLNERPHVNCNTIGLKNNLYIPHIFHQALDRKASPSPLCCVSLPHGLGKLQYGKNILKSKVLVIQDITRQETHVYRNAGDFA
jgi:hypothetical protein